MTADSSRGDDAPDPYQAPTRVSVIVPAFNEEPGGTGGVGPTSRRPPHGRSVTGGAIRWETAPALSLGLLKPAPYPPYDDDYSIHNQPRNGKGEKRHSRGFCPAPSKAAYVEFDGTVSAGRQFDRRVNFSPDALAIA